VLARLTLRNGNVILCRMARPLDPTIDRAITDATLSLLRERGFARMSMEAVSSEAGVGKPAIYRRFRDKAELVASVIREQLPEFDVPDLGDTRAELWQAVQVGFPEDGAAYVGLIGGLIAEQQRHPELIEAFRRSVLLPRRALVQGLIERGQARGDIRADIPPMAALDMLAGPLLARVFAGEDTGPRWRKQAFATWWDLVTPERNAP
jgi:AcrR family transcriptional regulator